MHKAMEEVVSASTPKALDNASYLHDEGAVIQIGPAEVTVMMPCITNRELGIRGGNLMMQIIIGDHASGYMNLRDEHEMERQLGYIMRVYGDWKPLHYGEIDRKKSQ